MALGSQLPIRLEQTIDARLQAAAIKTGTTKSALIRLLATTFVEQCIDENGRVSLPPDWDSLLAERDHRSASATLDESRPTNVHSITPIKSELIDTLKLNEDEASEPVITKAKRVSYRETTKRKKATKP